MHEVGIAQNIIEQVEKKVAEINQTVRVLKISVRLGKLAGVNAEALQFGFDIAKKNSRIPFAQIVVREIPASVSCPSCQKNYSVEKLESKCKNCGNGPLKIISGKEISLEGLEYE
jgi:hydrogenase nickel incorporation protein HypA/HybF